MEILKMSIVPMAFFLCLASVHACPSDCPKNESPIDIRELQDRAEEILALGRATSAGCAYDELTKLQLKPKFDGFISQAEATRKDVKQIFETYARTCALNVLQGLKTTNCIDIEDFASEQDDPGIIIANFSSEFRGNPVCGENASDVSAMILTNRQKTRQSSFNVLRRQRRKVRKTGLTAKNNAIRRLEEHYEFLAGFLMLFRSHLLNAIQNNTCSSDREFAWYRSSIQSLAMSIIGSMANISRLIAAVDSCISPNSTVPPHDWQLKCGTPDPEPVKPFDFSKNCEETETAELYRELCHTFFLVSNDVDLVKQWVCSSSTVWQCSHSEITCKEHQ